MDRIEIKVEKLDDPARVQVALDTIFDRLRTGTTPRTDAPGGGTEDPRVGPPSE